MMPRHTILPVKFGGSILTDKTGDSGVRTDRVNRIAEAVAAMDAQTRSRLVIILGGGSIGHRAAVRHGLAGGPAPAGQIYRMSRDMFCLKGAMAEALERLGVAAFPFHEGSVVLADGGAIRFQGDAVRAALAGGATPILSGGPVFLASGMMVAFNSDRLAHALLADGRFTVERFVLISNVAGVLGHDGVPIAVLDASNRHEVANFGIAAGVIDVSGGMQAKVAIALDLATRGVESTICGLAALAPDRFGGIVSGSDHEGTRVVPAASRRGTERCAEAQ